MPDGAIQGVLSSGKHQPKRAQPSAGSAQHWLTPARAQAHEASACSRNIICVSSTLCEFFDHRLGRSRAAREDLAFARKRLCLQSHRGSPGKPVPIPSAMANFEQAGRANSHEQQEKENSGSLGPWQQPRLRASRLCGAPHCTDQGSVQRGLSPARAQPSTGSHQRGLNMQQKHHLRQQHPLQVHRWAFFLTG